MCFGVQGFIAAGITPPLMDVCAILRVGVRGEASRHPRDRIGFATGPEKRVFGENPLTCLGVVPALVAVYWRLKKFWSFQSSDVLRRCYVLTVRKDTPFTAKSRPF